MALLSAVRVGAAVAVGAGCVRVRGWLCVLAAAMRYKIARSCFYRIERSCFFIPVRALSFSVFYRLALMCLSVCLPICIRETQILGFPLFARVSKGLAIPTHRLSSAFIYPTHTAHTASGFLSFFFAAVYILINSDYQDFYID